MADSDGKVGADPEVGLLEATEPSDGAVGADPALAEGWVVALGIGAAAGGALGAGGLIGEAAPGEVAAFGIGPAGTALGNTVPVVAFGIPLEGAAGVGIPLPAGRTGARVGSAKVARNVDTPRLFLDEGLSIVAAR